MREAIAVRFSRLYDQTAPNMPNRIVGVGEPEILRERHDFRSVQLEFTTSRRHLGMTIAPIRVILSK
jgi:hypothetical protein